MLAGHGAQPEALQVYAALVRSPAPALEARRALLAEARTTADAAGDGELSREFTRQLDEPGATPAAK